MEELVIITSSLYIQSRTGWRFRAICITRCRFMISRNLLLVLFVLCTPYLFYVARNLMFEYGFVLETLMVTRRKSMYSIGWCRARNDNLQWQGNIVHLGVNITLRPPFRLYLPPPSKHVISVPHTLRRCTPLGHAAQMRIYIWGPISRAVWLNFYFFIIKL